MPDPWNLNLSGPMRRALFALNESGRLYRWGATFGVEPLGHQFQEQTIIALVERGLVELKRPSCIRRYYSHYAALTGLGRLFAAQQKRFGGMKYQPNEEQSA